MTRHDSKVSDGNSDIIKVDLTSAASVTEGDGDARASSGARHGETQLLADKSTLQEARHGVGVLTAVSRQGCPHEAGAWLREVGSPAGSRGEDHLLTRRDRRACQSLGNLPVGLDKKSVQSAHLSSCVRCRGGDEDAG